VSTFRVFRKVERDNVGASAPARAGTTTTHHTGGTPRPPLPLSSRAKSRDLLSSVEALEGAPSKLAWAGMFILGRSLMSASLGDMRRLFLAAIAVAGMVAGLLAGPPPTPPVPSDARARELIRILKLKVLPKESGYLGIIGRSTQAVTVDGRTLAVQSQNYYMLTRDRSINYLHWLAPDDTHILLEGGPVDYFIFHPDGRAEKVTLGVDLVLGQRPVVAARRMLAGSPAP
jgi:predicted cupin superfamily sugar epimerase